MTALKKNQRLMTSGEYSWYMEHRPNGGPDLTVWEPIVEKDAQGTEWVIYRQRERAAEEGEETP